VCSEATCPYVGHSADQGCRLRAEAQDVQDDHHAEECHQVLHHPPLLSAPAYSPVAPRASLLANTTACDVGGLGRRGHLATHDLAGLDAAAGPERCRRRGLVENVF